MEKRKINILRVIFVAVSLATLLEYTFICGMFTGPIMMAVMFLTGFVNGADALRKKEFFTAYLLGMTTLALCMGYWKLMF